MFNKICMNYVTTGRYSKAVFHWVLPGPVFRTWLGIRIAISLCIFLCTLAWINSDQGLSKVWNMGPERSFSDFCSGVHSDGREKIDSLGSGVFQWEEIDLVQSKRKNKFLHLLCLLVCYAGYWNNSIQTNLIWWLL